MWHQLLEIKANGLIEKIGFTLYCPKELNYLYNTFKPEIVQIPFNIFEFISI